MPSVNQPLSEMQEKVMQQVDQLRDIADKVGDVSSKTLQPALDDIYMFLTQQFIPHEQAEKALTYDHQAVERLTAEFAMLREELATGNLSNDQVKELRRVLYTLHALVALHFKKEEEAFLPLFEKHLTSAEMQKMFSAKKQPARQMKSK